MPNDLCLQMEGAPIDFARDMNILGLNIDSGLTIVSHVKEIFSRAGRKLTSTRRISNMLDANSIKMLFNSQALPSKEYFPLPWNWYPKNHPRDKMASAKELSGRSIGNVQGKILQSHCNNCNIGVIFQQCVSSIKYIRWDCNICIHYEKRKLYRFAII